MNEKAQILSKLEALENPPSWIPEHIKSRLPKYDIERINECLKIWEKEQRRAFNQQADQ
jgi:hypothetical protein